MSKNIATLAILALSLITASALAVPKSTPQPALKGDATADNQTALQAALDAAARAGKPLILPAGTFLHSDVLIVSGTQLSGQGAATILRGTTPNLNAIILGGSGSSLSNLQLAYKSNSRVMTDKSSLVLVQDATKFRLANLQLQGSDSTGIMVNNSTSGTILNNRVENTLADSIHITNKSNGILVEGNETYHSGDDGIAVVSYEKNTATVKNVTIRNNRIIDNIHARGISVVGGENVLIENNTINCARGFAGIYIASEVAYKTFGVNNITVRGNTTDHCGSSTIGHDSIMVYTDNLPNSNVTVENNTVKRSRRENGVWVFGLNGVSNSNVTVRKNKMTFDK